MKLEPTICYNALLSRDARFDGKFYIAVRTTGVYCRPICPAPTALQKNCTFYPTAATAEKAGYRPCLRCFPESSPAFTPTSISSETVLKAVRYIQEGDFEQMSTADIAGAVGVSTRHLRRLFEEHVGVSPMELIKTRRVQLAKKLLNDTNLPMSKIAFVAGFPSIAQFNAEIKATYNRTPTALRKLRKVADTGSSLSIKLFYRPPLNWQQIQDYFRQRLITGVESFSGGRYARLLMLDESYGVIGVAHHENHDYLTLTVPARFWGHLQFIIRKVRELFDLDADTLGIATDLATDDSLRQVISLNQGIRLLGSWDFYELSIRAIIGQQITVAGATTLTTRLIKTLSEPANVELPRDLHGLFPLPEKVAKADLEALGFTKSRADTLKRFSAAYHAGDLEFDNLAGLPEKLAKLIEIKGIGDWTANYIAMRALRETDAFPAADLGLLKAYGMVSGQDVSAKELAAKSEAWRPWRAYAAMYLWQSLKGVKNG